MNSHISIKWDDAKEQLLEAMWADGHALRQIAIAIAGTEKARNAVLGKAHRMKLGPHLNPPPTKKGPFDHHRKRHGNADKPSTELVRKARERGGDIVLPSDSKYLRSDVWLPLPGTTPVTLEHREGCCWPVDVDHPSQHFCNEPITPGRLPYCPVHMKRYKTKEKTE